MGSSRMLQPSPPPQRWGSPQSWGEVPEFGAYLVPMSPAKAKGQPNRQRAFGDVVARVIDAAKARGMTIKDIEQATGLGSTTWYGWADGRWTRDPSPTKVNQFFDGLGASRDDAYQALEWETAPTSRRRTPSPIEDPLLRELAKKLNSPKTTPAEKLMMRRTIQALIGKTEEAPPST